MTRRRAAALAVAAAVGLPACGTAGAGGSAQDDRDRVDVVVALYPYEYVLHRLGGDAVSVTNLVAPGAEPHDAELTPQQVGAVADADLVVYSRGFQPALDTAVDDQAADRAVDVLSLVDVRALSDEGESGTHEDHADDEHDAGDHADAEHDHAGEDPHVWLDPSRLARIAAALAERLAEAAPDDAATVRDNATRLAADLQRLDGDLRTGLSACARRDVVTSHDAFGYLTARYGLEQVPLTGLSPDSEPSPRRLADVARTARERGVTTVFFEELVSPRVAEQLAREVGATARVLDPLEGAPADGDYLTAMRANLDALRTALDCA